MATLVLSSIPAIVASKRRPSRRKPKRASLPRFRMPFKRAFSSLLSSFASSPLATQLPAPLDLLPPLINGSRRNAASFRGGPLLLLFSAGSASVLGLNLKEIARIKVRLVLPETGNAAVYFLLGFVLCFLICKAIIFAPRRRSGWRF
jgi:hypothetical protein